MRMIECKLITHTEKYDVWYKRFDTGEIYYEYHYPDGYVLWDRVDRVHMIDRLFGIIEQSRERLTD